MLSHYDPRTDRDTIIKIGDVVINKAKAPGRNGLANSFRCIGAVNSIDRCTEVHSARAHWIAGPASHKPGEIRLPLNGGDMLRIPIYLAESKISGAGLGLFCKEFVWAGAIVWTFHAGFDYIIDDLPQDEILRNFVLKY